MAILKEDNGDAPASIDAQYTISVGDVFQGTLNPTDNEDGSQTQDTDWIRVTLTAGTIYRFSLAGIGAAPEEAWFALSLRDANGDIVSETSGRASSYTVEIEPVSTTGTYYVGIERYFTSDVLSALDYEISMSENTTPEGTYDEIADYLTNGYWDFWEWAGSSRRAFDVEPGGTLTADITALTPAGQQLARWALEAWTSVTGIGFEFVDGDAHITFDDKNDGFTRPGRSNLVDTLR